MSYNPTVLDIKLSKAKKRTYQIKIELLNRDMKIIDEIQGELTGGSRKIDANSDIRRTCDLTLFVKNKEYTIGENSKITRDRMIRLWYGVYNITTKEYVWYDYGTYRFTTNSLNYNSESNVLSINCVDLMNNLINTPVRNALDLIIEKGTNIRDAMIKYINVICGIKNYIIPEMYPIYKNTEETKLLPYELSYGVGTSAYDPVKEIRDIYAGYETYFDGGVFICQRIPTLNQDDPFLTDSNLTDLVIDETNSVDLDAIKNITEVWGKDIEAKYYSEDCPLVGNTYIANVPEFGDEFNTDHYFAIKITSTNPTNSYLKINTTASLPIMKYHYENAIETEVPLPVNSLLPNYTYVFKYNSGRFVYVGQYKVHSIVCLVNEEPDDIQKEINKTLWNCNSIKYLVNPDSPYTVDKIGEIWDIKSGGVYDYIGSDELGLERAEWENYRTNRLTDTITLTIISIPWLDVNKKIEYTIKSSGISNMYIIKSISENLGSGIMDLELIRFYPDYTGIVD